MGSRSDRYDEEDVNGEERSGEEGINWEQGESSNRYGRHDQV